MRARYVSTREPPLQRGEWLAPAAGAHSYLRPVRSRFDPPRRRCPHCELVSQTERPRCPVCDAPFFATWREKLRARWRNL